MQQSGFSKLKAQLWRGSIMGQSHPLKTWLEIIGLVLCLPLLALLFDFKPSALLDTAFPWLMLPSVLVALRYGTGKGLVALVLLSLGFAAIARFEPYVLTQRHFELWVGIFLVTVISGEIAQYWQQRYLKQQEETKKTQSTLRKTERSMQVLQLSHAQLEEEMLGATQSLKSSLDLVERTVPSNLSAQERKQWLLGQMMVVLSTYDWLETGAFFQLDASGQLNPQPLAKIGNPTHLSKHDFLVQEALYKGKPVSVPRDLYLSDHYKRLGTPLIAAIPVVDDKYRIHAILTIEHLNFVAFSQKNLNLLAALCAWLGTLLSDSQGETTQTQQLLPYKLAIDEIHASLLVMMSHKRSVTLSNIWLPKSERGKEYLKFLQTALQDKNRMWVADWGDHLCLHLLLPYMKLQQVEKYEQYVEQLFMRNFGHNFNYAQATIDTQHLENYENKHQLIRVLAASRQPEKVLAEAA